MESTLPSFFRNINLRFQNSDYIIKSNLKKFIVDNNQMKMSKSLTKELNKSSNQQLYYLRRLGLMKYRRMKTISNLNLKSNSFLSSPKKISHTGRQKRNGFQCLNDIPIRTRFDSNKESLISIDKNIFMKELNYNYFDYDHQLKHQNSPSVGVKREKNIVTSSRISGAFNLNQKLSSFHNQIIDERSFPQIPLRQSIFEKFGQKFEIKNNKMFLIQQKKNNKKINFTNFNFINSFFNEFHLHNKYEREKAKK